VYERLTPKGRKAGFIQLMATQLTSAIWHGLYPGEFRFLSPIGILCDNLAQYSARKDGLPASARLFTSIRSTSSCLPLSASHQDCDEDKQASDSLC
jgi:hypothetical protein